MNIKDYAALVRQMRIAQRTYFRDRTPEQLSISKELERRVDKETLSVLKGQRGLFDEES